MSIEEMDNKDLYQNDELEEQVFFFNKRLIFDENQYLKINKKELETTMASTNKLAQGIANMIKEYIYTRNQLKLGMPKEIQIYLYY